MQIHPPTVTPKEIKVKIPTKGLPEEAFMITINNPSSEKIAYRLKTSKPLFFNIEPGSGFIDSKQSATVSIQPVQNYSSDCFTKLDHFAVQCAPAPKSGNLWKAEEVFTPGSECAVPEKDIKTTTVPLIADSHIPQPPRGTKMSQVVNIDKMVVKFPSRPKETEKVTIMNPTAYRVAYKVTCTRPKSFTITNECGIIEPGKTAQVTLAPTEMTKKGKLSEKDHFLIQSTAAPTPDDWKTTGPMIFDNQWAEDKHICQHKIKIECRGGS